MTLSAINHKETVSTTLDGVIYWANPRTSAVIDSLGNVYNRPLDQYVSLQNLKKSKKYASGKYQISFEFGGVKSHTSLSFSSLFARMILGISIRGKVIQKIDDKKQYTVDNVKVVAISTVFVHDARKNIVQDCDQTPESLGLGDDLDGESKTYLIELTSEPKFITEDFAEFPTLELANWHQSNIDKGKANAEIVMKYNSGWACAEEVYLQSVSYRDGKPYEHFRYVMENEKGIQEVKGESTYSFSNLPYLNILGEATKAELLQKRFKKEDADLLFDTIQSANVLVRKAVEVSKRGI